MRGAAAAVLGIVALTMVTAGSASGAGAADPVAAAPWVGNGPFGGSVTLAGSAAAPGVLVATDGVHSFRSTDDGRSWTSLSLLHARVIAAAPSDPARFYAATADGFLVSRDGGGTWAVANASVPSGYEVTIAVAPSDPDTVYLSNGPRLLRSGDAGATWDDLGSGLPVDPDDGTIWVTQIVLAPGAPDRVLIVSLGTAYASDDRGAHWQPLHAAQWLTASQQHPSVLLAVDGRSLIRSGDGGSTWETVPGAPSGIVRVTFSPAGDRRVYGLLGTGCVLVTSRDGGAGWETRSPLDCSFTPDPSRPDVVFTDTAWSGNLRRSSDAGATWTDAVRGMRATMVTGLAITAHAGSALAAAGGRIFTTADGGGTWNPVLSLGQPFWGLTQASAGSDTVYAAGREGLFVTGDAGASWVRIGPELPAGAGGPLAISPSRPSVMYTTVDNGPSVSVYRSADGGETWTQGPEQPLGADGWIVVAPRDPDTIYIPSAPVYRTILRSSDGGRSWSGLSVPNGVVGAPSALAVDPENSRHLLAGVLGTGLPGFSLVQSRDGGRHWSVSEPGDNSGAVSDITYSDTGVIYVAVGDLFQEPRHDGSPAFGLFASTDGGRTWRSLDDGLGDHNLSVLAVGAGERGRVYAGTFGSGVVSRPGLPRPRPVVRAPAVHLRQGLSLAGSHVPVTVHWRAGEGVDVCRFELARRWGAGRWRSVALADPLATSRTVLAPSGRARAFRARGISCDGRVGAWSENTVVRLAVHQESWRGIRTSAGWSRVTDSRLSGGAAILASCPGRAVIDVPGTGEVAYVATTGPSGGWPTVAAGDVVRRVSLRSSQTHWRRLAAVRSLDGSETMEIRASPEGRTTLDAVVVLRPSRS